MVVVSIVIFCLQTHPFFKKTGAFAPANKTVDTLSASISFLNREPMMVVLVAIDQAMNVFFLIEYLLKLLCAPNRIRFSTTPFSLIEVACLFPYYIGVMLAVAHPNPNDIRVLLEVLFFTKSLRILRVFLLMKHFMALKILVYTLRASTKELLLLCLIVIIAVVIFACLIYYAENYVPGGDWQLFTDIPVSCWWALVTITTVGYGDYKPTSWVGYIVGSLCSTSGVLIIALTVPIIVSNFSIFYTYAESTNKLAKRREIRQRERRRKGLIARTTMLGIGARMAAQMLKKRETREKLEREAAAASSAADGRPLTSMAARKSQAKILTEDDDEGGGGSEGRSNEGLSPRKNVTYEKKTVNYFRVEEEAIKISDMPDVDEA